MIARHQGAPEIPYKDMDASIIIAKTRKRRSYHLKHSGIRHTDSSDMAKTHGRASWQ